MKIYSKKDKETAKDFAYRALKNEIMLTNLKPGQLLSETDLANQLSLSRTPVREALMMLRTEHLIEVKPQYGSYVTFIDMTLIEQAIFMRSSLEKETLKLACNSFTRDALFELDKNLFSQKLVISEYQDDAEFHNLDQKFHNLIFKGVNKDLIWESIQNISSHYNRMRVIMDQKSDKNMLLKEHQEYVRIIKENDFDSIDNLIYRHIIKPSLNWDSIINENPSIKEMMKQ